MLHIKVKWALVASALSTAIQAIVAAQGPTLPAWAASACTGSLALLAGYSAPSGPPAAAQDML